jgi:hypothetical protein
MSNPRTFTIVSQPYYNQYCKQYQNILLVNMVPDGPLGAFIRRLQLPRLYKEGSNYNGVEGCGLAITNFFPSTFSHSNSKLKNGLLTPNEIPDLYSFLTSNGYQIETQLTNMMNQSQVKLMPGRQIVCMATYFGDKQPSIVYMK